MLSAEPALIYPIAIALPLFVLLYLIYFRIRRWDVRRETIDFDYPRAERRAEEREQDEQEQKPTPPQSLRGRLARGIYPFYRRN